MTLQCGAYVLYCERTLEGWFWGFFVFKYLAFYFYIDLLNNEEEVE